MARTGDYLSGNRSVQFAIDLCRTDSPGQPDKTGRPIEHAPAMVWAPIIHMPDILQKAAGYGRKADKIRIRKISILFPVPDNTGHVNMQRILVDHLFAYHR